MVTHIPPPSPSLSAASLSTASRHGSRAPSTSRSAGRPSVFPPSPPSSYTYAETIVPYAPSSSASASGQGRRSHSTAYAPSAASTSAARTAAASRRGSHRRSRRGSDGGTSSSDATSESVSNVFPWFAQTGDVEIVIRDRNGRRREKKYLLHSLILAQNSSWFANEFSNSPVDIPGSVTASRRNSLDPDAVRPRWRYELRWDDDGDGAAPDEDALPVLVSAVTAPPPSSNHSRDRSRPPVSSASFFRNFTGRQSGSSQHGSRSHASEGSQRDDDIVDAYDNMLMTFYNHAPHLDTLNIASAYVECKTLLQVASYYNAVGVVGPRCDHHLLRYQNKLWSQVAKYPSSYLKLAYTAKSRAVFTEALIHVVGQWPSPKKQLSRNTPSGFERVFELIEDKVDEMEDVKSRIEAKLFRITLTTSRGEKVGPLNSWADWLAMSLFRQWLAENTSPERVSILKDSSSRRQSSSKSGNVGRTFRLLAAGGDAYLDHDELKRFLKKSPADYSREGLRRFERRMDELKNLARDAVKPLARSFLEFDTEGEGAMPYLTCTRVDEGDLRWVWRD